MLSISDFSGSPEKTSIVGLGVPLAVHARDFGPPPSRTHSRGVSLSNGWTNYQHWSRIPHARARSEAVCWPKNAQFAHVASRTHARGVRQIYCATVAQYPVLHPRAHQPLTPKRGGRTNFLLRVRAFYARVGIVRFGQYLSKSFHPLWKRNAPELLGGDRT